MRKAGVVAVAGHVDGIGLFAQALRQHSRRGRFIFHEQHAHRAIVRRFARARQFAVSSSVHSRLAYAVTTVLRARYRLIGMLIGVELLIASLVRLVLFAAYRDNATSRDVFVIFAAGLLFDVLATLTAFLPLFAVVSMFRLRWLRPRLRMALVGAICFALCFDAFVQFFFFDEYSARYNHLALDYLMYPDEVFGNIFASYNVPLFAGIALVAPSCWRGGRRGCRGSSHRRCRGGRVWLGWS